MRQRDDRRYAVPAERAFVTAFWIAAAAALLAAIVALFVTPRRARRELVLAGARE